MKYLTEDEVIEINRRVINLAGEGSIGVLDSNGLNSVIEAPKQVFFGQEAYPTIWLKAAYYLQKITKKHIFADGNKRTALESAKTFLLLNGIKLKFSGIEVGKFIIRVTNSPDSEEVMLKVAQYLKEHQIID
ncbi:death-on-curing family protein [Limosilactobacillus reuteri]|uniref:Death-on-curing family protein n=1 Tax=Limosilactobacillus reuteri TaxID=1598 RepID=A0AB73R6H8_LIMRT|nr:type II toxin-antitoxin system death-on-curing family toxin [Limosilactobacillus reuteri]OYS86027.1 death-on-curing family protein [Limosilactobacillus reuteri]OYS88845.1 death-on-curing family protein [Limosilactobacillus reuteri]OYS93749.1 death-on-curing family protein [Limosilactobacillus reuteri]OYS96607.1 death-on-curing family protein [Limosilactobacillus reuteri]OYS98595.1 death-on-curing family protein [Limosilactobacillus reuteri]